MDCTTENCNRYGQAGKILMPNINLTVPENLARPQKHIFHSLLHQVRFCKHFENVFLGCPCLNACKFVIDLALRCSKYIYTAVNFL